MIAFAAACVAASCASAPPRQSFRFASDLSPSDAYVCVTTTLRRLGFEAVTSSAPERTVVAVRRTRSTVDHPGEWWQISSTVTTGTDSATVVESVAGTAPGREGPFAAPPAELAGMLGELAARCQWPARNPSR